MEPMRYGIFRNYVLPFLGWLFLAYVLSSGTYAFFLLQADHVLPSLIFHWTIPFLIAFLIGIVAKNRILKKVDSHIYFLGVNLIEFQFVVIFIISVLIGFTPLAKGLYFNLSNVTYLSSLDDLKKHQQPPFLQLEDWYTDRLRVIPLSSYEFGTVFHANKVHLRTMFLLPLFSNEGAYREGAKAWLAFDYRETITKSEFLETKGKEQFQQFLSHFKKINVRGFSYFESYPEGPSKQVYLELAKTHSFFRRGFAHIYQGQVVDRDLLAQYEARKFLYYFLCIILPLIGVSGYFVKINIPLQQKNS